MKAAEMAQCMPFIEKLPDGIDTVLGERRVVGNGTHYELMKNCEIYKKLYSLQMDE